MRITLAKASTRASIMSRLLERTRELLSTKTTMELFEIAKATGVSYGSIRTIRYKPEIMPAVDRVEKLYEHLSGHSLEVK